MRFSRILAGITAVILLLLVALLSGPAGFGPEPQSAEAAILDEVAKLLASDAQANARFGQSVAIGGDTIVVGAHEDDEAANNAGAVYIFERDDGGTNNWGEVKKLTASDAQASDNFGFSVAISGDTAVVGAYGEDDGGSSAGAVYIFERDDGGTNNWGEVKKLTASDAQADDFFGWTVAVSGDTAVVGAHLDDGGGGNAGAVYVFERDQGGVDNWGEVKKLTASDAQASDFFGYNVAVSGDTAIVGARGEDAGGSIAGAAYVFGRDEGGVGNWGEVKKLTASDAQASDNFGFSVATSGDTAVVGANLEDAGLGGSNAGAAYVFGRDEGGVDSWGEVTKLTASDAEASDFFGGSVAVDGDAVIVGALGEDAGGSQAGAAYVFGRDEGGADSWGEVTKLTASDAQAGDSFGVSVAVSGDTLVVGGHLEDGGGNDAGAAYVFDSDVDGDGVPDATDNCPSVANPGQENIVHPGTSAGDHCEDPDGDSTPDVSDVCPDDADNDSDADGVCNGSGFQAPKTAGNDNCPNDANSGQENADGDPLGDTCDPCPTIATFGLWLVPAGDDDCDGFTSADEGSIGTDPGDPCGAGAWPPDFDDNTVINTTDVFQVLPPTFGTAVPPTSVRRDLFLDGVINTTDVFRVLPPFLGSSCTP